MTSSSGNDDIKLFYKRIYIYFKRAYPVQTKDALHEEFVVTLFEKH